MIVLTVILNVKRLEQRIIIGEDVSYVSPELLLDLKRKIIRIQ